MGWIRASRPSPAMIVAALALVAALAGSAVAEVATTAKLDKKERKQVKRIARKQINKLASGLSVASAERANSAETANTANSADSANSANTANTAAQAQNAATANGVRPVRINFARPMNTPETTFIDQGGVRITGQCDGAGSAIFRARSTANNGLVKVDTVNSDGSHPGSLTNTNFDTGQVFMIGTLAPPDPGSVRTITVAFRGAGGTAVSGEVVVARGAAAAQCVIAGTLFVG